MENKILTLNEIKKLLIENDFKYINIEDNDEELDNYLTIGQLIYKIQEPININILYQAINGMGLIRKFQGKTIPNNPEYTVFYINKNDNDDYEISILYKEKVLEEIKSLLNENEFFLDYMKKENEKQFNYCNDDNFKKVSIAIDTNGSSIINNKIISISLVAFDNNNNIIKSNCYFINNNWDSKDIDRYTTPKREGKKSAYDYLKIPLPGMNINNAGFVFEDPVLVLREIYRYCKNSYILVDNMFTIDFVNKMFDNYLIENSFKINNISKGIIEIPRLSKIKNDNYYKMKDLIKINNISIDNNGYSFSRANIQKDIFLALLKSKVISDKT